MAVGMRQTAEQMQRLDFRIAGFIPALFALCVLLIVYILFAILWPYGLVVVFRDLLTRMIRHAVDETGNRDSPPLQQVMTIGVYTILWIPFGVASLPLVLLGLVGRLIRASSSGETQ